MKKIFGQASALNQTLDLMADGVITNEMLHNFNVRCTNEAGARKWDEKLIQLMPKGREISSCLGFAEDGQPLYIAKDGERLFVVHGKTEGRRYRRIEWLSLKDGRPFYVAEDESQYFLVQGDSEGERYDFVRFFTWHNGRALCVIRKGETYFLTDGVEWRKGYDHVHLHSVVDGKPMYEARHVGRHVVHGQVEGKGYHEIFGLTSAEGKPLYVAKDGGKSFVVHGDVEGRRYDYIFNLNFAQGRPVYEAVVGEEHFVVSGLHGEQKGTVYSRISEFSVADGQLLYVGSMSDTQCFIVHGKQELNVRGRVSRLSLAPDSVELYCLHDLKGVRVVHGSIMGHAYTSIDSLGFADGHPLYHATNEDGVLCIVYGGGKTIKCEGYQRISDLSLVDGHPLFQAHHNLRHAVIYGDEVGKAYDDIFSLTVTPTEIFYGARKGRNLYRVSRKRA